MIKYFQIVDSRKVVSPLQAKCMQSLRDKIGDNEYKVAEVPYHENIFEMLAYVDRVKYEIAASVPEACIVDTDCFVSQPLHSFTLDSNVPYFAKYDFDRSFTAPDICYFYVNGCTEWFKKNLPASLSNPKQYGPTPEVFKSLSGFEYIPDMSYCHFYGSMRKVKEMVSINKAVKKLNILASGITHLNALLTSEE